MIVSVGIDIIEVYRIEEAIKRTPRFVERVFTEQEKKYCQEKGKGIFQSYAARFAAKEAFLKALKTGWRGQIKWQEIEVCRKDDGMPYLKVSGNAEAALKEIGANSIHLSISHTSEHAVATVILEKV
ncbi:MAG: holo-ACP synthase [Pyrinomonadaceae bacterium]|nr:holo-ACP synthase [Pyrinomonadaceae bacterium]MCX7640511.1 holo-ACP synthase [Pyrinomonadaceae bacterium]MDW8303908.1 holo-ACP synthase [Acidobacteriota bacterium]